MSVGSRRTSGGALWRLPSVKRLDRWSHMAGRKLRVVDGSVIGAPGQGRSVRLRAVYDVDMHGFPHVDPAPVTMAESLDRIEAEPGKAVVAGRGYPKAGGSLRPIDAGADDLVRAGRRSLRLRNTHGTMFDLAAAFGESERCGACDRSVLVIDESRPDRGPLAARLRLVRKPPNGRAGRRWGKPVAELIATTP